MTAAVHRIVEQKASTMPDAIAIVDAAGVATYREINQRANALARHLSLSGLTRGALAFVRMPPGTDLAVVLLGILKAGACYAWSEPGTPHDFELPSKLCIQRSSSSDEEAYLAIDVDRALRETASSAGPNLPILTRGPEVACVLPDHAGRPNVLVPHATIAALPRTRTRLQTWEGSAGALDLWVALMSGTTLSVRLAQARAAA